jgi:hypothetical protein
MVVVENAVDIRRSLEGGLVQHAVVEADGAPASGEVESRPGAAGRGDGAGAVDLDRGAGGARR